FAQFRALMNYKAAEVAHSGGNGLLAGNFRPLKKLNGRTVYASFKHGYKPSEDHKHWHYAHNGAAKWFRVIGNEACLQHHQSPINIEVLKAKHDGSLGAFTMDGYDKKQGSLVLKNNGHSDYDNEGDHYYDYEDEDNDIFSLVILYLLLIVIIILMFTLITASHADTHSTFT
ncbi:hypothetical protein LSAT2_016307, partial [Lamellibrachia satsuma]